MSDQDGEAGHNSGLLRGLIWAGLLLAPVAVAIVLLGGGGSTSLRFAVLLVAVSVVLVGASVLIGNDPVLHRMEVEDRVAEACDRLRRELRAEFARDAGAAGGGGVAGGVAGGRGSGVAGGRGGGGRGDSGFFRGEPMRPGADPFARPDHAVAGADAAESPGPVETFGTARVVSSAAVVPRQRDHPVDGYAGTGDEDYGYAVPGALEGGFAGGPQVGFEGGYAQESDPLTGDPGYRARRHRPSVNDTNVGSHADFAEFGGSERDEAGFEAPYGGHGPPAAVEVLYGGAQHPDVGYERQAVGYAGPEGYERTHDSYGAPPVNQQGPAIYGRPQVGQEPPPVYGRPQVGHERPAVYGRPQVDEPPPVYGRPQVDEPPPVYGRPQVDHERPAAYGRPHGRYERPRGGYERPRGGQDPRARGARPDERYVGGDSGPSQAGPKGPGRW